MARYQAVRGNPEDKLSIILDDFSGGVNTTSSDDLTPPNEARYMSNYKLEQHGDLRNREGWNQNAVSEMFGGEGFPVLVPTQKSKLYGTAHEPHAYYQPNLIPRPWDFSNFEFHGDSSKEITPKNFDNSFEAEKPVVNLNTTGWDDFDDPFPEKNLIPNGWDSFTPHSNNKPLGVFYENLQLAESEGWYLNFGTSFKAEAGKEYVIQWDYEHIDGFVPFVDIGTGTSAFSYHSDLYSGRLKADEDYRHEFRLRPSDIENDRFYISIRLRMNQNYSKSKFGELKFYEKENEAPKVKTSSLENGLTRIQTWGGSHVLNQRYRTVINLESGKQINRSLYIKSKYDMQVLFEGSGSKYFDVKENEEVFLSYDSISTTYATVTFVAKDNTSNLDFIASDPAIVESRHPAVTIIKDKQEDGRTRIRAFGGSTSTKLASTNLFPEDERIRVKMNMENLSDTSAVVTDTYRDGESQDVEAGKREDVNILTHTSARRVYLQSQYRDGYLDFIATDPEMFISEEGGEDDEFTEFSKLENQTIQGITNKAVQYTYKFSKKEVKLRNKLMSDVVEDTLRYKAYIENMEDEFTITFRGINTVIPQGFSGEVDFISHNQTAERDFIISSEGSNIQFKIYNSRFYDKDYLPFTHSITQEGSSWDGGELKGSTLIKTSGGSGRLKFGYALHKDIHPFTTSVEVLNLGETSISVRGSSSSANYVDIEAGAYKRVRIDSSQGSQPRIDFLVPEQDDELRVAVKNPFIVEGHITDQQIKEKQLRYFPTRISKIDKGTLLILDIETENPELFDIALEERITDENGNVEIKRISKFKHLAFKQGRFFSNTKAERTVTAGTVMGEDRKSFTTDIVLTIKYSNEISTVKVPFKINRLTQPQVSFDETSFTDQVLLMKVMKNEFNVLNRILMFDTLKEYQATLTSDAEYELEFLIVHRLVKFSASKVSVSYEVVIDVINFKITHDKLTRKVTNVGKLNTNLTPYLKDFGTQTLNIANIGSEVSKGSLLFTGTDHGIIEVYDDKGAYKMRYIGNKKTGVTNNAYKPSPLEVRRVGFNVLGTSPLTWIDNTGTTSKSIQGIYVTDDKNIPAAVLPMGKPFKVHIMYTGDKADFTIELSAGVGEEDKKKLDYDISTVSNDKGLFVARINFKTQPQDEVEFKISFKGDDKTPPMYDYYHLGQIPTDAKPVETLDVGSYGITQVWDRYVYFKGDTFWYSDFSRFDYVPNLNYITLPLRPNDNIVKIIFFRTSYMIFTQERIYKISGMFDTAETRVELVSDTVGCVAPDSIAMVDNKLIFLSTIGLVALKAEVFRQNLENIEVIDDKVQNMIETTTAPYAVALKNQYLLFLNNNFVPEYLEEKRTTTSVGGREVNNPNVVRYYTDTEAFAFDLYNQYQHPLFLFEAGGNLFSYRWNTLYTYEDGDLDFDESFDLELETPATNFGYPAHEKKFKQVIFKLGKESYQQRFDVTVMVDGNIVHEEVLHPENTITKADIANSRFHIRKLRLPSLKGKNIAILIRTNSKVPTTIMSISYIYKLGKIRERRAYR